MSFIQIISKVMGVSQLVQVGFGPGQDVGSLALAPQDEVRLHGSVFKLQKYLVKAVLVVLHWPVLSHLAKLDQRHIFSEIKEGIA